MRYALSPGQAALSIAYAMAALLCLWAGFRDWRKSPAPKYPFLWLIMAMLLLTLGYQEATARLENITQVFREQAKASGWYNNRGFFQMIAVGLVLLAGGAAFAGLTALVRKSGRRYLPLLAALIYVAVFAAVQGISFHTIDHLMHTSVAGLLIKNWCALLGIALACFSVLWNFRFSIFDFRLGSNVSPEASEDREEKPATENAAEKEENRNLQTEAALTSDSSFANRKSKIENQKSEEDPLPILIVHQWLFAFTVFAAIHATSWDLLWPNGVFLLSLSNALLWFGSSRAQVGSGPIKSALLRIPWTILLPALYFLGISLWYATAAHVSRMDVLLEAASCALTLLTAIDLFSRSGAPRPLFEALGIVGILICFEALLYLVTHLPSLSALRGLLPFANGLADNPNADEARLSFPLRYWNAQATLLLVLSALTLGLQAAARTEREQWLWRGAFGLHSLCLLLTGSRTGLLCFVLMGVAFCLRHNKTGRTVVAGMAGALTACFLGLLLLSFQTLLQISGSLRYRLRRWDYSLSLLRKNPLSGGGWEFWVINRSKRFGVDGLYLWILASGGLPALAAVGSLIGGAAWELRKFLKLPLPQPTKELVFALALGLAATLVHGLMETVFIMPSIYLFVCLLLGLLVGLQYRTNQLDT